MHEERLDQCIENWADFKKHKEESVNFRADVTRHNTEITNLSKQHELTMQKIDKIESNVVALTLAVEKIDRKFEVGILTIKNWFLIGILSGLITIATSLFGGIYYLGEVSKNNGQYQRQVEINTKRLDVIEQYNRDVVRKDLFKSKGE